MSRGADMDLRLVVCLILLPNLRFSSGQRLACSEGQWQCDDGTCITAVWRCDGEGDCLDGSDEMDCNASTDLDCPAGQFPCLDSVGCVDMSARCDGQKQCPTGSDEEDCPATEGCLESEWMCGNHICIPKELHCNGQNDCMDNSDEEDCGKCSENGLRCPEGKCLSAEQRCDGEVHCSDGSDEPITCGRTCSMYNGGCSHKCTDESWGVRCICPVGHKLSPNGAVCEDLDECASSVPQCAHYCTNTIGSYYCHCREGFKLNGDRTCQALGNATKLLVMQGNSIGLLNVKSKQFTAIKTPVSDPVASTYDIMRGWYYWADGSGSIYKTDGRNTWTAFTGPPGIKGLACDWLNGYLFWTNKKTESIYMQSSDAKSFTALLSKYVSPSELVLLPIERFMFWINKGLGDGVTLERSWMDGSERSTLVVLTAQFAHSLTADVAARRLYWISDSKKSVETVKADGTGRYSFTGLFNKRPALSLAVFEGMFFWVDQKGLWQAPQDQSKPKKFIMKTDLPLLSVFHELQQPKGSSPCAKTHCLLCQLTKNNPAGFTCACPYFKVLLPDGTCKYPQFLYGTATTISLLEFKGKESSETELFSSKEGILSFDVYWYREWLYWANQTGHVQHTELTLDKTEFISTPLPVCLLSVDQRSGNLFWVSCDLNIIGTTAVSSNYPQQLYHTTKEISNIYLDWLRGGLFWLEEGRLFGMGMMGGKAEELLQIAAAGVGGNVAFDIRAGSLFWNSKRGGLTTLSLLKEKSHQAGRRWNISGSVMAAFEPFLLSISNKVITLWDRRDGSKIQSVSVKGPVLRIVTVLGDIQTVPHTQVCNMPSWMCHQSSICLPQNLLCDGKRDCPDGDDEELCVSACPPEDFMCMDRRNCIPRILLCDGRAHCHDGSDEVDCPTVAAPLSRTNVLKCRSGSVLCRDGMECVLYSHVCDGEADCKDGSDELGCNATQEPISSTKPNKKLPVTKPPPLTLPACLSPSVLCPYFKAYICVSESQFCDGIKDCPDGFDEQNCVERCRLRSDFLCKNHRSCVPKRAVCDGRRHCPDGSDEMDCPNVALGVPRNELKCRFGSKRCTDGLSCVLMSHVCDGEWDCRDGSDEDGCDTPGITTIAPTTPPCTSPSVLCPGSSVCVKPTQMCDGRRDCPDGSDEKCVKRCSSESDFHCKDRRTCVPLSQVCDGRSQCNDGSDEFNCPSEVPPAAPNKILRCHFGSKLCQDGLRCVLLSHICDGERDCQDGSDEAGCDGAQSGAVENEPLVSPTLTQEVTQPPTMSPCTSPSVLCPGSTICIKHTQMCDGKRDCPDGSDERCIKRCNSHTDFHCKDRRRCIPKSQVCDGRSQCTDGSDEVNCLSAVVQAAPKEVLKCRFGSRLCNDRSACVLLSHICDGETDCQDGSDEEACDSESAPGHSMGNELSSKSPKLTETVTLPPTKPPCTSPSVLCPGSSVCVKTTQMCDGTWDCPDGYDEKCVERCPANYFHCKDRRSCVPWNQVCDGRSQCNDGSDEVNCQSAAPPAARTKDLKCRFGSKLCDDGTSCVLLSHICDGDEDCHDGSDEEGCDNGHLNQSPTPTKEAALIPTNPPCTSPSVLCPGSSICIKPTLMCDGTRDCPDGFDEKCINQCPSDADFRCNDRQRCIPKTKVCDGHSQCNDGSDEMNCHNGEAAPKTSSKVPKCRFGSKLCRDGMKCVLLSHVCDGEADCQDGSDEEGCDATETGAQSSVDNDYMNESPKPVKHFSQPTTTPPCTSPSVLCPGTSICLKATQICDRRKDCPDGSDEKCVRRCPGTDFRCKDRRSCVPKSQVCDGRSHCNDGSDEFNCQSVESRPSQIIALKCRMGSRMCRDGTDCVLFSHVCDGETDCRDGSDEEGCDEGETIESSSPNKQFCSFPSVLCPDSNVCINPSQLCDGIRNCPDGSDENCVKKCADRTDFLCKDRRSCVPRSLVCDGRAHCYDGSDEAGCRRVTAPPLESNVLKCRRGSKPCKDGQDCVLFNHVCDGEIDCMDGSDEEGCQETCDEGEFQCAHGKMCIPENEVCDGKPQCRDHSDEVDCWQRTKSCEHRCADGKRCIPKKFLCDGEPDCLDGTDELNCNSAPTDFPVVASTSACITPSVLCPGSSQCISQHQLCNGQRDCPDGFDEMECIAQCENPADFLCKDQKKCIPKTQVCDGHTNCPDGSDEKQCQSELTSPSPRTRHGPLKCRTGFKLCKNGLECIMYSHVCDGEHDCQDGSDEEGCEKQCKPGQFQCSHGRKCIQQEQVCDGKKDCQDYSDEMDCSKPTEGSHQHCDNKTRCVPKTFLCDGEKDCTDGSDEDKCGLGACAPDQHRCESGQCISQAFKCDGYPDCHDHSDEAGCPKAPHCPAQLRCPHSHECLQKEWLCDGEEDCKDGSDENNCNNPPAKCRKYQFQCRGSGLCVPRSWRCDGKEDCENGVDEDKCIQRKCPYHLYQCGSKECLEPRLVCDGITNCIDGSDEGVGCAQRNCSSPSAPACDHRCVSTPKGPRCYCGAGFRLQSSSKSCMDIDECTATPAASCKHLCQNTRGSYSCLCHPGFYLEPDDKSCKTKDEPLLLASVQSEMLILGVHSGTLQLLSSADRPVFALDFHWAEQRVYWVSPDHQSIRWADMITRTKGTLIKCMKSDSIAVDWVGKNLYWVDRLVGHILAIKLSSSIMKSQDYTVVLGENLEQTSSLVLIPDKGLMLWSEIGSIPQIERSGMDGSQRKVLVSQDLIWPVSLAYDFLDDRIYWADEKLHCIGSASLDGDDVKILQLTETPSPFSVAIFSDRMFWSDTKRRTIRSADKKTGKNQTVLLKRPGQPFALKLMHALSQPAVSSPCDNLRCSNLCLLAPAPAKSRAGALAVNAAVCRCPKGFLISQDRMTCFLPRESSFILLLSRNKISQIYLRSMRRFGIALKKMPNGRDFNLPGLPEAMSLDINFSELFVFVAYSKHGSVDVLKLTHSLSKPELVLVGHIVKLQDDSVTALAVDWVTSSLYWSCMKRPDIHVTSHLENHTISLLQGPLIRVESIALHPSSGRLCYFAIVIMGSRSQTEIHCAWMDGRNKVVLWKRLSIPISLVFTNDGTRIYWADAGEGIISSIGVDGSVYKEYKTGPNLLVSFTLIENFFFWVTQDKDVSKLWFSDGFQPKQLWFQTNTKVSKIRSYNNETQSGSNHCSNANGGCVHLCLPYPGGRTCKCARGFYSANDTSCVPLPSCPSGEKSCLDGSMCIGSKRFCDGREDCPDQSDEQDCPGSASFGTIVDGDQSPQSSLHQPDTQKKPIVPDEVLASCDLQRCNGHGNCITEGKVTRCHCLQGYTGEFCQNQQSHPAIIVVSICLVSAVVVGALIFTKRRWEYMRSRFADKEKLLTNMVIPDEQDSDSEELESPVDVKNLQPIK